MAKTKIRFIDWTRTGKTGGVGIYGLPAEDGSNDSGEYQIGDTLEIEGDVPAGWLPKVEILSGGKASKDAEFVTGATENPTSDKGSDAQREEANLRGTESKDQADQPRRGRPRNDA